MGTFRAALAMYLYVALMAHVVAHAVIWALALDPAPLLLTAATLALDPGLSHLGAPGTGARLALLGALDALAFLAVAAVPFLAYAAAARRAAAPHPALMRALGAALSPIRAWALACDAAADRVATASTARDSVLVAALMSHATYAVIHAVDMGAMVLGDPSPPLAALRGALHGAASAPVAHAGLHHALAGAADAMSLLALFGSTMALASIVARVLAPACARLWRRL